MPRLPSGTSKLARPQGRRAGPRAARSGPPTKKKPRVTPGRLILVVGPSGAGKDTLIAAAQRKFKDDPAVVFPRRTITRPEAIGEDHVPVSRREFQRLEKEGAFFLAWTAHGLRYGVPADVAQHLAAGRSVVVNVSRDSVDAACALWPATRIVQVTVALDALRARLEARGREAAGDIEKRLKRAARLEIEPERVTDTVDNSRQLASAVRRFNMLIASYIGAGAAAPSAKR